MVQVTNLLAICLIISCNTSDDLASHSQEISYYPSGKVQAIKPLNDSLFDGECTWFYPNGNLKQKITYLGGKKNGYAFYFYESGALANMKLFKNNISVGYSEDFYDHSIGISKSIAIFNDSGRMIYRQTFDSTGKLLKEEEAKVKK
jgi:antitoxin component YwqK of YwqJK toxin-antitoxin module